MVTATPLSPSAAAASPRLRFVTAADVPLDVRRADLKLELGRLWQIELRVMADTPSLDFEAIIGREASLTYDGLADEITWAGLCATIHLDEAEPQGLSTYDVTLVPRLYFASLDRKSRIFQGKSAVEIAKQLLEEWNVEATFEISEDHPKLEYRVQYRESTFNFLCRILEEAGITFHYRGPGDQMVVTDAPEAIAPRQPIAYGPDVAFTEPNVARRVRYTRRARPGRYTMVDHDLSRPNNFTFEAGKESPLDNIESQIERVHYRPGAFLVSGDEGVAHDEKRGRGLAEKRLAAKRRDAQQIVMETTQFDLRPGETFHLIGHPHEVLADEHKLLVVSSSLTLFHDDEWRHEAQVVRADHAYRPPLRTPRPVAQGIEHATVVGPEGEEIHTDGRGRIKVHFHWDREGGRDGNDTCWVQRSQAWSGPGFGAVHMPRVGHEVLVEFIDGNPDRPIVTGTVFTGPNRTAVDLPQAKTVSGFRTQSTHGTGGSNHLLFNDLAGRELVSTRAQRDQHGVVNRVMNEAIGMLRSELVGRVRQMVVGMFSTESVGVAKAIEAGELITLRVGTSVIALEPEKITIAAEEVQVIGDPIKLN